MAESQSRTGAFPITAPITVPTTARAASPAASATQRSCWRSTPRARRKRSTSAAAAIGTPRPVTTPPRPRTTDNGVAKAGTASGLETDWYGGSNDPGESAADTRNSTGPATATLAHHRQRGEGSDPLGVSSRMKLRKAGQGMKLLEAYTAT